jgi:hypothetical protein
MGPVPQNYPACFFQHSARVVVPSYVSFQFGSPKLRVRLRIRQVFRAPMPKTAVDKDSDALPAKQHVSGASKVRKRPGGNSVAKAASMHELADAHFRLRVATPVRSHGASNCLTGSSGWSHRSTTDRVQRSGSSSSGRSTTPHPRTPLQAGQTPAAQLTPRERQRGEPPRDIRLALQQDSSSPTW